MRKVLITLAIVVLVFIAIIATWIFAGRQLSLFSDRFGTIETASSRIDSVVY
jgi:DNA-binding transcriptional regulator of glucitol operon